MLGRPVILEVVVFDLRLVAVVLKLDQRKHSSGRKLVLGRPVILEVGVFDLRLVVIVLQLD